MHVVDCLQCNVTQIANARGEFEFSEHELSDFVQRETRSAIDRLFSDLDRLFSRLPMPPIQIAELTISFGKVVNRAHPERFQQQLYQALQQEILKKLPQPAQQQLQLDRALDAFVASIEAVSRQPMMRLWSALFNHWCAVNSQAQAAVRIALLALIRQPASRATLARLFADQPLRELLRVLAPEQADFIWHVIHQPEHFALASRSPEVTTHAAAPGDMLGPTLTGQKQTTAEQLTEFSLAFIAAERGSRFNRKSYLRSVLQRLAAHYNLAYSELCQTLHTAAEHYPQTLLWRQELLDITAPETITQSQQRQLAQQRLQHSYEQLLTDLSLMQRPEQTTWQTFFTASKHDSSLLDALLRRVLPLASQRRLFTARIPTQYRAQVVQQLRRLLPAGVIMADSATLSRQLQAAAQALKKAFMVEQHWGPIQSHPLLAQLSKATTHSLRQWLLQQPNWKQLADAMARQLPASQQQAVLAIVHKPSAVFWSRYMPLLRKQAYRLPMSSVIEIDRALWSAIWQLALQAGSRRAAYSLDTLLLTFIRRLRLLSPGAFAMTEAALLAALTQAPHSPASTAEAGEIADAVAHLTDQGCLVGRPQQPDVQGWLAAAEQVLIQHCTPVLAPLTASMSSSDATTVRSALLLWLQDISVRLHFLALPEPMQTLLLAPILPENAAPILALWQADFCLPEASARQGRQPLNEQNAQYEIRLFCLTYLAHDRGSQFNQQSFGRTLVRQLSAHFNIDSQQFIERLRQALADDPQAQQSFAWLWVAAPPAATATATATEDRMARQTPTGDSAWLQMQSLMHGVRAGHNSTVEQWQAGLARLVNAPADLLLWFRQLQQQPHWLTPLLRHPAGAAIVNLILSSLLRVTGHVNPQDGQQLLAAIEHFAKQCDQTVLFYQTVVNALLQGQVLNLEAMLSRCKRQTITATAFSAQGETPLEHAGLAQPAKWTLSSLCRNAQLFHSFLQQPVAVQFAWLQQHCVQAMTQWWPLLNALYTVLIRAGAADRKGLYSAMVRAILHSAQWPDRPLGLLIQPLFAVGFASAQSASAAHWQRLLVQRLVDDAALLQALSAHQAGSVFHLLHEVLSGFDHWDSKSAAQLRPLFLQERLPGPGHQSDDPEAAIAAPSQPAQPDAGGQPLGDEQAQQIIDTLVAAVGKKARPPKEQWQPVFLGGLVILTPYLPALFTRLALLHEQQFQDANAQNIGASAMIYLCTGENDAVDPTLAEGSLVNLFLNRLPSEPLTCVKLTAEHKHTCDGMLDAVIGHWEALGNTSITGLRETFLQRQATVRFDDEIGWLVRIKRQPFDVLLDRLPWSIRTVKHPFMHHCLNVEW